MPSTITAKAGILAGAWVLFSALVLIGIFQYSLGRAERDARAEQLASYASNAVDLVAEALRLSAVDARYLGNVFLREHSWDAVDMPSQRERSREYLYAALIDPAARTVIATTEPLSALSSERRRMLLELVAAHTPSRAGLDVQLLLFDSDRPTIATLHRLPGTPTPPVFVLVSDLDSALRRVTDTIGQVSGHGVAMVIASPVDGLEHPHRASGVRQCLTPQQAHGLCIELRYVGYGPSIIAEAAGHALLAATALALLISLPAGLLVRRGLQPLQQLAAAVDAVAHGDPHERLPENWPAETGMLARSFNRMAVSLEVRVRDIEAAHVNHSVLEQQYSSIIAHLSEGVIVTDRDGTIEAANGAAERIFGYAPDALRGQDARVLSAQPFSMETRTALARLAARGEPLWTLSGGRFLEGTRYDGTVLPIDVHVSSLGASGAGGFVLVVRDMREPARMAARLHESQQFLTAIFDHLPIAISVQDPVSFRFIQVNRAFQDIFGTPPSEVLGKTIFDLVPAPLATRFRRTERQTVAGTGRVRRVMHRIAAPRGELICRSTRALVRDSHAVPCHLITVTEDRTDAYRADLETLHQKQRIETYLSMTGAGLLEVNADGRISDVNARMLETLSLRREDVQAMDYRRLPFAGDATRDAVAAIAAALAGPPARQVSLFHASVGDRHLRWKVLATGDPTLPRSAGAIVVADDVTEFFRQKVAAHQADRAKSEFLANMSHELRTPLNAIIGYGEMLGESVADDPERARDALDLTRIVTSGWQLLALIDEILELAKLEARKVEPDIETIDAAELIDELRHAVQGHLHAQCIEFTVEGRAAAPLITDIAMLKRVLDILIRNAAKITTPGGHVALRYRINAVSATFEVEDTGAGIAEQAQGDIFDAFALGDQSATRTQGGVGLGLAICKQLCELLNGNIQLHSRPGSGSVFRVTLSQPTPIATVSRTVSGIRP
jgi:PAS domain S-box-containing protein